MVFLWNSGSADQHFLDRWNHQRLQPAGQHGRPFSRNCMYFRIFSFLVACGHTRRPDDHRPHPADAFRLSGRNSGLFNLQLQSGIHFHGRCRKPVYRVYDRLHDHFGPPGRCRGNDRLQPIVRNRRSLPYSVYSHSGHCICQFHAQALFPIGFPGRVRSFIPPDGGRGLFRKKGGADPVFICRCFRQHRTRNPTRGYPNQQCDSD